MSKKAWSPGRMIRSEKTCGCGLQRSPETALMLSTCSEPRSNRNLRDVGHELALADARLELLRDQLVGAVDHRAGGVEQHDLVDRLDLAGVEHHLLAVADRDALVGQGGQHRRLDDVDADRHVRHALGPEQVADLAGRGPEQAGVRGDRAAQPDHPGVDVLRAQPRAVEPVVLGGRAEVPDVGVAAARQQRVAGHLVARPLADMRARDVPDVVEVEQQDRADVGRRKRRRGHASCGRCAADRRSSALPSRRSSSRARRVVESRQGLRCGSVHDVASRGSDVRSSMLHTDGGCASRARGTRVRGLRSRSVRSHCARLQYGLTPVHWLYTLPGSWGIDRRCGGGVTCALIRQAGSA